MVLLHYTGSHVCFDSQLVDSVAYPRPVEVNPHSGVGKRKIR